MTDPRALLDTYAAKPGNDMSDRMDEIAPQAFAALRAVLDRHGPMQYGDEATDEDFEPTDRWCKECSGDRFHRERFPCATRRDITAALTCGDTP